MNKFIENLENIILFPIRLVFYVFFIIGFIFLASMVGFISKIIGE